jgi:hypothetical protein
LPAWEKLAKLAAMQKVELPPEILESASPQLRAYILYLETYGSRIIKAVTKNGSPLGGQKVLEN